MKPILDQIDALQQEIDSRRPLGEQELATIRDYFRVGLTYTSNALEGNSLTESETKVVIEEGITIGGKSLRDHNEAIGHAEAFEHMYACTGSKDITEDDICTLHRHFYTHVDAEKAGVYRKVKAIITGSKYPLPGPDEIPMQMKQFMADLANWREDQHPVEVAARAHKEFVFIHPFVDGNGRVARLLMNLILLQSGYTIAIIPPVLRHEYIELLEEAHRDEKPFLEFIARAVKETMRDYLRLFGE